MAKKLSEILAFIATNVGSDELKKIAENATIATVEIEDEQAETIEGQFTGLLTLEAAKNNSEILNFVKKEYSKPLKKSILTNIDDAILEHAGKIFEDDKIDELKGVENTQEKITKFMELSQDFISRHSKDPKAKQVTDQLKQKIEELNNQLVKTKTESETKLTDLKNGLGEKLVNNQLRSLLATYNFGDDYTKEEFIKNALFDDLIRKANSQAKLTFDWDQEKIQVLNPENPEIPLFVNNKKIEDVKEIFEPLVKPFLSKKPGKVITGTEYEPAPVVENKSALINTFQEKRQQQLKTLGE